MTTGGGLPGTVSFLRLSGADMLWDNRCSCNSKVRGHPLYVHEWKKCSENTFNRTHDLIGITSWQGCKQVKLKTCEIHKQRHKENKVEVI